MGGEIADLKKRADEYEARIREKPPADELDRRVPDIADKSAYPIDALGEVLGRAAHAIASTVDAPAAIAAHSVLAVAAFAAQDKANIVMDGRTLALSLFMLTIAESGDRKSACDKVASAPLADWQHEKVRDHLMDLQTYKNAQEVYDCERKVVLRSKKSAAEKAAALGKLDIPVVPPEPVVICQEPTLEGLQRSFRLGLPGQALFSDEGAQFFGGHAMNPDNIQKTIAGLSKFWDGSPITRTRAAPGESATLYDRRLSIHLLVQPVIARTVLSNPLLMKQGILARFLIAEADSLAGTRLYKNSNPMEHSAVIRFHQVIRDLLAHVPATRECGALELPALPLSREAKEIWIASYNGTERELSPGGLLELVKPVTSKAGENAIRMAGVFAVIERTLQVTAEQMERAWELATYYLQHALRAAQLNESNEAERSAREVFDWLKSQPAKKATIDDMQRLLIPKRHRKSVAHIRTLMTSLEISGAVVVAEKNGRGEPGAWEVIA